MAGPPPGPPPEVPVTANGMRRALRRADEGVALDAAEAAVLLQARGADLERLCAAASRVRDAGLEAAGRPGVITYSKSVFVPLTRLCRDRCHYCTFVTVPGKLRGAGHGMFLSPDEVLDIARRGAALGCKEALFTLGDKPEDRWPEARAWLDAAGYDSTLDYLRAMSIRVLEETGLLPHLNPGVLSWTDFQRLKPVAASMGMMLETTATRLWSEPGGPHHGSPDKEPAVRLRVLEDAGRSSVPFTSGLLIGIGETYGERADSLFALRRVGRTYRGLQEVIMQNFRAKPDTAMRGMPDAELAELAATVAVARLLLGPTARIQAPPNLVAGEFALLISAGIDDWGGVSPLTPDHVNPERPWPQIETLAGHTAAEGFRLRERLPIYPEFVQRGEPWLDPRLLPHVTALAEPGTGLAVEQAIPRGLPWQEPDDPAGPAGRGAGVGRTELHRDIDTTGRTADRRGDFDDVYGDWDELRTAAAAIGSASGSAESAEPSGAATEGRSGDGGAPARGRAAAARLTDAERAALAVAADDPTRLTDEQALTLFHADGPALDAVCRVADDLRRSVVGDEVTYVVTRNINFTNVCYTGCRFCAFAQRRTDADAYNLSLEQIADRAEQAWDVGAVEVCLQGGIHPDLPGTAYFDIARAVRERVPGLHLHAFSPMEVVNGATRAGLSIRDWLCAAREAGVDTIPGTAAEILDDEVRWVLTKGKLPADTWIEVVSTAHELGIRSSSTMMYGHVDQPRHWLGHLRTLARMQRANEERGVAGFTEFVTLPFVHTNAPVYLAGIARPGPTHRDNRVVTAMARLLLHPHITNIQTSWVKLGTEGAAEMLRSGANDLGGTLMEETISRMAGSAYGSHRSVAELRAIAEAAGRPSRLRTTTYGRVPAEREETALAADGRLPALLPLLAPAAGPAEPVAGAQG
ncbi:bifunctional FO biosynthesis protein CofGH [Streptomyces sp. B6B3]|uniref:bifunctional FO biosynthesis protein CofGH n=1 Tax=Streptomyces sp. B6B3 TaxID=3153570 RepID=UPI00325DB975